MIFFSQVINWPREVAYMVEKIREHRRSRRVSSRFQTVQRAKIRAGDRQLTRSQGRALLEEQSHRYFGINAKQFRNLYRDGVLDGDHLRVTRVAMLLPYMDDET